MTDDLPMRIKSMLAAYLDLPTDEFDMRKNLELDYAMDSTELTEIAHRLEKEFSISIEKSTRKSWSSGDDIAKFLTGRLLDRAPAER